MKKLYKHQKRFLKGNPNKAMLVWEMQTGKTLTACEWIKKRPNVKMLVACPKAIIKKWERELKESGAVADVVSRDAIKKIDLNNYGGLVLDEAQDHLSPCFTKQRSARTTAIYTYVRQHPKACILMLTATPVRSQSWNCHTAGCFLGVFWPVKKWKDDFFYMTNKYGRLHLEQISTWRKDVRPYLESISDIVLRKDCVDVPKEEHKTINIKWTQKQQNELEKQLYEEPSAEWHTRHRIEQGEPKWKELKDIIDNNRKVIVVVYYRDQIDDYIKRIGNDRQVFVLNGDVKDQDKVIENAKASDDCVFLLQASMGSGFSASEFSVMVFASMSTKYTDYIQSTGRMNSLENLHENQYIYLIGGRVDRSIMKTILSGHDFNPHKYMLEFGNAIYITGTTKEAEQKRSEDHAESVEVVSEELPF